MFAIRKTRHKNGDVKKLIGVWKCDYCGKFTANSDFISMYIDYKHIDACDRCVEKRGRREDANS